MQQSQGLHILSGMTAWVDFGSWTGYGYSSMTAVEQGLAARAKMWLRRLLTNKPVRLWSEKIKEIRALYILVFTNTLPATMVFNFIQCVL